MIRFTTFSFKSSGKSFGWFSGIHMMIFRLEEKSLYFVAFMLNSVHSDNDVFTLAILIINVLVGIFFSLSVHREEKH